MALLLVAGCGGTAPPESAPPAKAPRHRPVHRRVVAPLRLPARLPDRTIAVPILLYHRIDVVRPTLPALTQRLTVSPARFDAQVRWLRRAGFHAVTARQLFRALEDGAPLPSNPLMITFDDGYRDVLGKASPTLERLHMPAIEFVITSRISGPDPSFLTWPQLRLLERRGVEIGSHTVDHAALTDLSDEKATWELEASRRALERHLGHPVQWFAYPYGAVDARVVGLARKAGYVLAATEHAGTVQSAASPLELRRIEVLDSTSITELAALLGRVAAQ